MTEPYVSMFFAKYRGYIVDKKTVESGISCKKCGKKAEKSGERLIVKGWTVLLANMKPVARFCDECSAQAETEHNQELEVEVS